MTPSIDPSGASSSFYGEVLARIHDEAFGEIATAAARLLVEILGDGRAKQVVDLGCGSGILAAELGRAGHHVTGVDSSAAMIDIARERAPRAALHVDSWRSFRLPACDAVAAIGEVVNYLGPDAPPPAREAIRALGRRARAALRPGGVLLLDVAGPGRVPGGASLGHRLGADWAVLFDAEENPAGRRAVRRITSFRDAGGAYVRSDEVHELELLAAPRVAEDLRDAGLRVQIRRGYRRDLELPGHRVLIARRSERD